MFDSSKKYKDINGTKEKILMKNDIINCFYSIINEINNIVYNYIDSEFNYLWDKLFEEKEAIQEDLKDIINQRIGKLYFEIENYRNELKEEWNVPFLTKEPSFDFEFQDVIDEFMQFNINIDTNELFDRISSEIKKEHKKNSNIILKKILRIFGINNDENIGFSRIFYDRDYLLEEFYDKNIRYEIKSYIDRANIEYAYINDKNHMKQELINFIDHLENEMNNQFKFANNLTNNIIKTIDNTSKIESYIEELKKKKKYLNIIIDCVNSFYNKWKDKINSVS